MKIAVFEYFTGGGLSDREINPDLILEGYAMFHSVVQDLQKAGHSILTTIDQRLITRMTINPEIVASVSSNREFRKKILTLSTEAEAFLVIAPERYLSDLIRICSKSCSLSLNSEPNTIKEVANKAYFLNLLKGKGVSVPETKHFTKTCEIDEISETSEQIGYPLVVKPNVGASCEGLSIVKTKSHLKNACKIAKIADVKGEFLIQNFCHGEPASVSLLVSKRDIIPISLNSQFILLGSPKESSKYYGGVVPIDHELKSRAIKLAKHVISYFPGLKGYVGVDLILTESKPLILEINPRVTVSYLGLSRVSNVNLGQGMLDSVLGKTPNIHLNGVCHFVKSSMPHKIPSFAKPKDLEIVHNPVYSKESNQSFIIATQNLI